MQQAQFRHFIGHSRLADGNLLAWNLAGNVPSTVPPAEGTRGVLQPSRPFASSHASGRPFLPDRWHLASGGRGHWCPRLHADKATLDLHDQMTTIGYFVLYSHECYLTSSMRAP